VNSITKILITIQLVQLFNPAICKERRSSSDTSNNLLFQQQQPLVSTTSNQLIVNNNNNYRSHPTNSNNHHNHNHHNNGQQKLKYLDVWYEVNEPILLNCSLRVNRDQHVVWHRKYDKLGVHVLTIGSETFISDLRIRPIKQEFYKSNNQITTSNIINKDSSSIDTFKDADFYESQMNYDDIKYTWNLEIRRLKKEDSALYYCVLNSENAYGQIYKLNVLRKFHIINSVCLCIYI
jgi:hypothetical protein